MGRHFAASMAPRRRPQSSLAGLISVMVERPLYGLRPENSSLLSDCPTGATAWDHVQESPHPRRARQAASRIDPVRITGPDSTTEILRGGTMNSQPDDRNATVTKRPTGCLNFGEKGINTDLGVCTDGLESLRRFGAFRGPWRGYVIGKARRSFGGPA